MGKIIIIVSALVLAVLLFIDLSGNKFRHRIRQDEQAVLSAAAKTEKPLVQFAKLGGLLAPVRRYFMYALQNGQPSATAVRLKQAGEFRQQETDNWVPFEAEQYIVFPGPSFVWHAWLRPLPYVWTEARDLYYQGTSDTVNRPALVRFLVEAAWLPTVLLPSPQLEWQAIDAHSARAVLHDHSYRVSAVFSFNADRNSDH